jgi:outer membrane protein TolC
VFTSGGASVRAARAELAAVEAERADLASRIKSDELALWAALHDLESAGERFDAVWQADLVRALHAAQERYDAGEGTLAELLDARRARLAALDEYETWRASRRLVRIRLASVLGAPIDNSILCDTDFRRSS